MDSVQRPSDIVVLSYLVYSDELVKFIIEKYSYGLSLALLWSQVADR